MRFIGWMFSALLLILVGWIGGPAAMAIYRVATGADPEVQRHQIADNLVTAYDRHLEGRYRLNLTIHTLPDQAPIKACGYDPNELLDDEKVPFLLSADWGSEVLRQRARLASAIMVHTHRTDYVVARHSPAAMAALTQCLDTPFDSLCRRYVASIIVEADSAKRKEIAENESFLKKQDQAILCTYLDGAAARRGIAKAAPASQPTP